MVSFFAAKANGKGAGLFVSLNSKQSCFYFKIIRQTGWNDQTKKGSFKNGATINLKINDTEACQIKYAVLNKTKQDFFHSFDEDKTQFTFGYYEADKGGKKYEGFGLMVKRGEETFSVPLSIGGAYKLVSFFDYGLNQINDNAHKESVKRFLDSQKNKTPVKSKNEDESFESAGPQNEESPKESSNDPWEDENFAPDLL